MKKKGLEKYYSGISGLQTPIPKYKFPIEHQSSTRLTYYSSLFNSIEINSSFYKIPLARTILKWFGEVPSDFKFTFKLWKEITHVKQLNFKESDVAHFVNVVSNVEHKSGSLLIQFPGGLKSNASGQLMHLLDLIQSADPQPLWQIALEFRDKSWYNEAIYECLESRNAVVVLHDKTGSATPFLPSAADFVYLRFHGPTGDYRGSYSDAFLAEYAGYIQDWLSNNKTVYVYFNNTLGAAIDNLTTLNNYLTDIQC